MKMENTMGPRNMSEMMSVSGFVLLLGTLIAGGVLLLIGYGISELFRSRRSEDLSKSKESSETKQIREISTVPQSGKKLKIKKRRERLQKFTHSWFIGALKGHTDSILDLHFSTNGKYIATCAEDCWLWITMPLNSQLDSQREEDTPPCSEIPLHRRPLNEENIRNRIKCDNATIARMLAPYVLTLEQRALMGYPVQAWKGSSSASVFYMPYPSNNPADPDINFMKTAEQDRTYNGLINYYSTVSKKIKCSRCLHIFSLDMNNDYVKKDQCVYHWGKCIEKNVDGTNPKIIKIWTCCEREAKSAGCDVAEKHVWIGLMPGVNSPLHDYTSSKEPNVQPHDGFYGVYGLDCEMCFTRDGLEMIQVALVDMDGTTVYNTYIKPKNEIVDYNTRFSGITASDLEGVTKTLSDVHKEIMAFIHKDTILIGHSLESDLRVLRLLHERCIDTSFIYPHYNGYPYRNGLKFLSRRLLHRQIQMGTHDPAEDARTAVDLMLLKLHSDYSNKKKTT